MLQYKPVTTVYVTMLIVEVMHAGDGVVLMASQNIRHKYLIPSVHNDFGGYEQPNVVIDSGSASNLLYLDKRVKTCWSCYAYSLPVTPLRSGRSLHTAV